MGDSETGYGDRFPCEKRGLGFGVLVETWTEEAGTFHVVRVGFENRAAQIMEVLSSLPPGAQIWETLPYGERVEIVFRTRSATAAAVA